MTDSSNTVSTDPLAEYSKTAAIDETKNETGKEIVVEKNPFQVRYGTKSLRTPAFENLLNQVTSIKFDNQLSFVAKYCHPHSQKLQT